LIAGRLLLRRELIVLPLLPYQWSKKTFKELLVYGANIQIGTVSQLIFEVATKLLLAKHGGATSVGYFEIANQLVGKIRMVIVSANQAIVPFVVNMNERDPSKLFQFYYLRLGRNKPLCPT
jgi:O-antigen/teichoic acid export membrane protein